MAALRIGQRNVRSRGGGARRTTDSRRRAAAPTDPSAVRCDEFGPQVESSDDDPDSPGPPIRTIRTGLFTSLDGIVDADDDWQFVYFDEDLMRELFAGFEGADDLLMGHVSYEGYARLRTEHPDPPVLPLLDARPKHVVSTTLADGDLDWVGATVISGDVAAGIDALKRSPGGDVLLLGSPTLVRWLLSRGLLDELVLTVFPIVVGSGTRLFQNMPAERVGLRLTDSRALTSDALSLRYTPAEAD